MTAPADADAADTAPEQISRKGDPMRLYVFKSDARAGLRAFAGDLAGSQLPNQFRPWHVVGVIAPDKDPPHDLPRADIEKAISSQGFQLWRKKAAAKRG
jgi:hypothetical protein